MDSIAKLCPYLETKTTVYQPPSDILFPFANQFVIQHRPNDNHTRSTFWSGQASNQVDLRRGSQSRGREGIAKKC